MADAKAKLKEVKAQHDMIRMSLDFVKFVLKLEEGGRQLVDIDPISQKTEGLQ